VKKFLEIAQGWAVAACMFAVLAGLSSGRIVRADDGESGALFVCRSLYDSMGNFQGCANPGAACTNIQGQASQCTPGVFVCDCP